MCVTDIQHVCCVTIQTSYHIVIHPDKTKHERAPEAFDLLKKVSSAHHYLDRRFLNHVQAESDLSDKTKREELDALIAEARLVVLKTNSLPSSTQDDDPKLNELNPPFRSQLKAKTKEMLIDEEVRRRKYVVSFAIIADVLVC